MAARMAMRSTLILAAAAAALLAVPASSAPAPAKSAAKTDWTKVVADTPHGWRMGNPKAKTQLVEYGSFNCPHCAAFAKAAMPVIRSKVASGQMSFEFRPKLLFPHDPSATVLARCVGKARVFGFTEDYMANQKPVMDRLRAAYKADPDAFAKAGEQSEAAMARMLARVGQMGPIASRAGVPAAKADQCLGDAKLLARVQADETAAVAAGVTRTPTFFVNGVETALPDLAKLGLPTGH